MFFRILTISLFLLNASSIYACVCPKEKAFDIGMSAIKLKFSDYEKESPYKIVEKKNEWHIYGTLPKGWKGGTPEAKIAKSNCTVTYVYHSK